MHPVAALGGVLLDLVYPEDCLSCHHRRAEVPWAPAGPVVAGLRPWDRPHLCAACEQLYAADPVSGTVGSPGAPLAVWSAARSSGALVSLVGHFKYHGVRGLAWPLARGMVAAMASAAASVSFPGHGPVLVPVPLHGSQRRSRGFNQAAVLALLAGRWLGWPVRIDLVARLRRTGQQAKLESVAARDRNVTGAFGPRASAEPQSDTAVVLVDDLVTSGATVAATAAALRSRGWSVAGSLAAGLASSKAKGARSVDTRRGGF